ncbi:hypothetical protein [Aliiglaciecola sp. NS0011-25]|uniref:hypothetical protein n=1 Tax=Aliiglaciecola sp. NS0011-25 TaxID=3127654 RepID=UPI00310690FF
MKKISSLASGLYITVMLFTFNAVAQTSEDEWDMGDWSEEEVAKPLFTGFVDFSAGNRISSDPEIDQAKTLRDIRLQVQWEKLLSHSSVTITSDLYYDGILDEVKVDIREFAWQGRLDSLGEWGKYFDLKLGQQVLTWGTGDYLFLNDLFPKDYQSFFAGRNDDYLKAPSLSAKLSGFFDWGNIDLVITPEFAPDNYINGDYFSFFSPQFAKNIAPGFDVSPPYRPESPEYALRYYKTLGSSEIAVYGYHGFHKSPSSQTAQGQPYFAKLNVYGASVVSPAFAGLIKAEVAYYASGYDSQGTEALIPNDQSRVLIGYEQELIKDLSGSLQWYMERTHDYSALRLNSLTPQYDPNRSRIVVTQQLVYRLMQQTLTINAFNFYSTSDQDGFLKLRADYSPVDEWRLSAGMNLFYGEEQYTFYNQFEDASNLYASFRYFY